MQAGLLIDKVTFYSIEDVRDEFGGVAKTSEEILVTKCYRRKLNTGGMGVNAIEEFISGTIVLQVRKNALIQDTQHFSYGNYKYKITLIDRQRDGTLLITGTRLNDGENE